MGKLLKWLVVIAFAAGLLYVGSYAGARTVIGQFLGSPAPDMGVQTVHLVLDGVAEIPDHPRAWEFSYSKVVPNSSRPAKIFVSLDGKIMATIPRDLDGRIAAWRRAKETP